MTHRIVRFFVSRVPRQTKWLLQTVFLVLVLAACSDAPQLLTSQAVAPGVYTLTAKHSGKNLDVPGGSAQDGLRLQQWYPWNNANQRFRLEPAGTDTWKIISEVSGKALEVNGGSSVQGEPLQQWIKSNVPWQLWQFSERSDGTYVIKNVHTGLVLDVFAASRNDGGAVVQWTEIPNKDHQRWKLTLVGNSPLPAPVNPPGGATAESVRVSVNWSAGRGRTTPEHYSINLFAGSDPNLAANSTYAQNLAYMKAGGVRWHYAGQLNDSGQDPKGWVSNSKQTWDEERINRVMNAADTWGSSQGYRPARMVNIPSWPSYMKTYSVTLGGVTTSGLLDPAEFDRYADFCAEFLRILKRQGRSVKYLEIFNEVDTRYWGAFADGGVQSDKLDELVTLFNKVAVAVKAVDPNVIVGGPALERPDRTAYVRRFVRGTRDHLGFLSWHFYASGDKNDSDTAIYNRTRVQQQTAQTINTILRQEIPGRSVPDFMDEYNISWTFTNNDPRMQEWKGAVYDALSMTAAVKGGSEASYAWNEADGIYGKLNNSFERRITTETFQIFQKYLVGSRVQDTVDDGGKNTLVAMAVKTGNRKSLLLINRDAVWRRVTLNFSGWTPRAATWTQEEISSERYYYNTGTISQADVAASNLLVPPNAFTVISIEDNQ
jgi:hypothetical protein